jgi:signal transduction histidine kinase/ActR/RegA family two-component response regulator
MKTLDWITRRIEAIRTGRGIGHRIYLALALSILPTIVSGYLHFRLASDRQRVELEGTLQAAADNSARDASKQLHFWRQSLANIGRLRIFNVAMDYQRFEGLQEFFDSIVKTDENYHGLIFVGESGDVLAYSTLDLRRNPLDDAKAYWQDVLGGAEYAGADESFGTVRSPHGTSAIVLSSPVFGSRSVSRGRLIGIFNNTFSSSGLVSLLEKFKAAHGISLDYLVTARSGAWSSKLNTKSAPRDATGSTDDRQAFCGTAEVGAIGDIQACLVAPREQLYAELRRATVLVPLLILISAFGCWFGAVYTLRSTTTTIRLILRKLEELANGDYKKLERGKSRETNHYVGVANDLIDRMDAFREKAVYNARNAAVANMIAMLAHDVRKPFTMLRMGVDRLLASGDDAVEMRQVAVKIKEHVGKACEQVNGMLADVMEISSDKTTLTLEKTSLSILIANAVSDTFRYDAASRVELQYELGHSAMVKVDSAKVGRVFSNILENARQAMKGQGQIWIQSRELPASEMVEVTIGNARSFIPPEKLSQIFDAFYTSGKKGGTGLGLAICQKIVAGHGGTIGCQSSAESGTEFTFTLPLAVGTLDLATVALPSSAAEIRESFEVSLQTSGKSLGDPLEPSRRRAVVARALAHGRPLELLIVDDEELYAEGLKSQIDSAPELEGLVRATAVQSPEEAVALCSERQVDVIISDVDLGRGVSSGFELVAKLRGILPKATICVHSNRSLPADYRLAIEVGADAFLPKPMSPAHLLGLLARAVSRDRALAPRVDGRGASGMLTMV